MSNHNHQQLVNAIAKLENENKLIKKALVGVFEFLFEQGYEDYLAENLQEEWKDEEC